MIAQEILRVIQDIHDLDQQLRVGQIIQNSLMYADYQSDTQIDKELFYTSDIELLACLLFLKRDLETSEQI